MERKNQVHLPAYNKHLLGNNGVKFKVLRELYKQKLYNQNKMFSDGNMQLIYKEDNFCFSQTIRLYNHDDKSNYIHNQYHILYLT